MDRDSLDMRSRPPPEDGATLDGPTRQPHSGRSRRTLRFTLLSFRLFLILFGAMALLLAIFTVTIEREHRKNLVTTARTSAGRAGDVIRRATRSSMLRNQRLELHEIIENIGSQPGIDLVRIYNKQGSIMFSTRPNEVGKAVDLQAPACIRCHAEPTPLRDLESGDHSRVFENEAHRVLGWIGPIWNEPDCSTSGCHAASTEQSVLGVLDVWMSLESVDTQLHAGAVRLRLAAGLMVLVVALSFGSLIRRLVQKPVERLIDATHAVACGDLEHVIPPHSTDELGVLARSFNVMTDKLRVAQSENAAWAATLEDRVRDKTRELRRVHAHALQMDRLASLGKLSATVAHEINNPLAGILTYARLAEKQLADTPVSSTTAQSLLRSLRIISTETRRCGDIASNLLVFARSSGSKMEPARLLELVDRSLDLVRHHLDLCSVKVRRQVVGDHVHTHGDKRNNGQNDEYSNGPSADAIQCAPGEIEQALLGLLVNAAEAMPHGGALDIIVGLHENDVEVSICDTGVGISAENQARIFEPFFSTKSEQNGVGLGLAVVYGIMQRHGGRIDVESEVDVGSTFTMKWPRQPPAATRTAASPKGAEHD